MVAFDDLFTLTSSNCENVHNNDVNYLQTISHKLLKLVHLRLVS